MSFVFCPYHSFLKNIHGALELAKNPPVMQETLIQSLGRENPLEKEIATHSSVLAWEISWTEEPGRLQSTGLQRMRHDWAGTVQQVIEQINKRWILPLVNTDVL